MHSVFSFYIVCAYNIWFFGLVIQLCHDANTGTHTCMQTQVNIQCTLCERQIRRAPPGANTYIYRSRSIHFLCHRQHFLFFLSSYQFLFFSSFCVFWTKKIYIQMRVYVITNHHKKERKYFMKCLENAQHFDNKKEKCRFQLAKAFFKHEGEGFTFR